MVCFSYYLLYTSIQQQQEIFYETCLLSGRNRRKTDRQTFVCGWRVGSFAGSVARGPARVHCLTCASLSCFVVPIITFFVYRFSLSSFRVWLAYNVFPSLPPSPLFKRDGGWLGERDEEEEEGEQLTTAFLLCFATFHFFSFFPLCVTRVSFWELSDGALREWRLFFGISGAELSE